MVERRDPRTEFESPQLERGLGLVHATSLNVANMLGAGPFITIPVLLATMGGPQGMLGWVAALVIVVCDGLIWAELGAAFPGSGGTYHYLREVFGGSAWGRFLPFLFMWQFLVSGTLEIASGYIGAAGFVMSLWPQRAETFKQWGLSESIVLGIVGSVLVMIIFAMLCQRIRSLGTLGTVLVTGVLAAVGTVIVLGIANFNRQLITFPAGAFHLDGRFWMGVGAATSIAVYDYLGYYNICHLGEEVRDPATTIPRSVVLSIGIVAVLYISMNVAVLGVVPWQETVAAGTLANQNITGAFMTKLCGARVSMMFTGLILWTCLAGCFAITLGYSRIIYAAAKNGDFFAYFAKLHRTGGYPWAALVLLSGLTCFFCFFQLEIVITGAVVMRIVIQFIGQIFALHVVRRERKVAMPFRMWLYPLPSLVALIGWVLLLATSKHELVSLLFLVYGSGLLAYMIRDRFVSEAG